MAYNRHAESLSLVPNEHDSADLRFDVACLFMELEGASAAGPTPSVADGLNLEPIANFTPASEFR